MKTILKLIVLYGGLVLVVLNSSADDVDATSKVHFEYQQF